MPLRTARIMWAAILTSTVMIFVVLQLLVRSSVSNPDPMILPVLAVAAVGSAIASFVVPSITYRQAVARITVPSKSETVSDPVQPASDILPPGRGPSVTRIVPVDAAAARRQALVAFSSAFILSLALSESIAMYGFALGFLGFSDLYVLPFFAASWLLIGPRFPTVERVLAPFERAKGLHIPRA